MHDSITVIVPTLNEAPNIDRLVGRIQQSLSGRQCEIIFVDDFNDDTGIVIERAAAVSSAPIRLIHRDHPVGGLSGAVLVGLRAARSDWCVVIDGDLQHPPEVIPALIDSGCAHGADIVVASRHIRGGSSGGLSGGVRHLVSWSATTLTRAMFPTRLRDCTDPMTGFFAVKRASIDLDSLHPRGFKILLEILARNDLLVIEEPFAFDERGAGQSKADLRQGLGFLIQLASLRFGRLSGFATIGAFGAAANLTIMTALETLGVGYLVAAVIAAIITITINFLLQEKFVFQDVVANAGRTRTRFARSLAFNGTETIVRTFMLWVIVGVTALPSVVTQAVLLAAGFIIRFVYHSRVVYRPASTPPEILDITGMSKPKPAAATG